MENGAAGGGGGVKVNSLRAFTLDIAHTKIVILKLRSCDIPAHLKVTASILPLLLDKMQSLVICSSSPSARLPLRQVDSNTNGILSDHSMLTYVVILVRSINDAAAPFWSSLRHARVDGTRRPSRRLSAPPRVQRPQYRDNVCRYCVAPE